MHFLQMGVDLFPTVKAYQETVQHDGPQTLLNVESLVQTADDVCGTAVTHRSDLVGKVVYHRVLAW